MKIARKSVAIILCLVCLLGVTGVMASAAAIETKTAVPTAASVTINGDIQAFQAYNIDGYNYFKLRDIAMAITSTDKQFEIGYDAANNAVSLTNGQAYTPVGGELSTTWDSAESPAGFSKSTVFLDGRQLIRLSAFLIGGNNYIRLRDIGAAIDFGVNWDGTTKTILIDTTSSYSDGTSNIGYFDPTVDYTDNPEYSVVYMMSQTGVLYDMFDQAFQTWADISNVEYSSFSANNDNDLFLTTIETFATQNVDGFIFDADNTIYPRIAEIADELEIPWMSAMAEALDDDGNRAHPVVGFDNYDFGVQMANWVIDYAKENWPDADMSEIGMMSMDFSLSPQIHERTVGAMDIFLDAGYLEENFFVADGTSTGTLSAEGGYNLATVIYSFNPQIKYWLVTAFMDDYADGAARAAEQAGIDADVVITTCGGAVPIDHWNAGEYSCWKSAVYSSQLMFAENIFFALYSFMDGTATPETIFPEWIDHSTNQTYAYVNLPTFAITQDNYQEYLEWVDFYTGYDASSYTYYGTLFPTRGTPPDTYGN